MFTTLLRARLALLATVALALPAFAHDLLQPADYAPAATRQYGARRL